MRRGLLINRVIERVDAGGQKRFAQAEADAHHRRQVVVHDIDRGKVHPRRRFRVLGDHQVNRGVLGHRARPLDVEVGFGLAP